MANIKAPEELVDNKVEPKDEVIMMRISGLNSGIDTEQMIKDIMTAQRIPVDRVFQQKVQAEWKRDAYRDVNTKLSKFSNFVFDLRLQGTFQKNVARSSREDILSVNATGVAQPGTYDMKVIQLATVARHTAENITLEGEGFFNIRGLDGEWEKIEYSTGASLESLATTINSNKNLGINAFAHGNSISFTTKATGVNAEIAVDHKFAEIFGGTMGADGVIKAGQNAKVNINGIATEHSSNTFDLNGITVNLLEANEGATVRVEVRHDVDAVVDKVKEFVNLYNELVDDLNSATREEVYRSFPPLTDAQRADLSEKEIELWEEKARSGLLRSDSIISGILSEMRTVLGAAVKDADGTMTLAQMGITTGSWYEHGRLNINEEKLRAVVEETPGSVQGLFINQGGSASETGIARRLSAALDRGMERLTQTAGKASISHDQSFLGNRIRDYESRLSAMEERLLRYEESQWRKFTAMERVLGQLHSQGDWLAQQLMTMQG